MAYYDYQIDGYKNISRIFIESPDEDNISDIYEDLIAAPSDESLIAAPICAAPCEVLLRNGKRLNKPSCDIISNTTKRIKKDCDNKTSSSSELVVKRNSKCDKSVTKTCNRRKANATQKVKSKPDCQRQVKTVSKKVVNSDEPENTKGKHD